MERAWIGVGILGAVLGAAILMQAMENQSLKQRVERLENSRADRPWTGEVSKRFEAGRASNSEGPISPSKRDVGERTVDEPAPGVSPEVLKEAVRQEREKERQGFESERQERFQEFRSELVQELADKFNWNEDQQAEVHASLIESFERRSEVREQVRSGELSRTDAREMMQEMREEIGDRLEEAVGVEGVEAIVARLPGRRGR